MAPGPAYGRCPRDGQLLDRHAVDDLHYLACAQCHGLWVPNDQLYAIALRVSGGAPAPRSRQRRPPESIREGTARCLCAGGPLMTNLQAKGVSLDHCLACGAVWLDGGEFQRVLQHYTGIASARAAEGPGIWSNIGDGLAVLEPLEPIGELILVLLEIFGDILSGLS